MGKPKTKNRVGNKKTKTMKKVLLSSIVVLALLSTSCKKDQQCNCTFSDPILEALYPTITIKDTKKKAKDACEALQTTYTAGVGTGTVTCEIE